MDGILISGTVDLLAIFCKGTAHPQWHGLKPTIPLNHPTLCPPQRPRTLIHQQYCNFVSQVVIRAHYQLRFWKLQKLLAERGFDPRTSGLWAQHASTAPLCCDEGHSPVWPYISRIWLMQYTRYRPRSALSFLSKQYIFNRQQSKQVRLAAKTFFIYLKFCKKTVIFTVIVYRMEFDKTYPWNGNQNFTQNSARGWWGRVGGLGVVGSRGEGGRGRDGGLISEHRSNH